MLTAQRVVALSLAATVASAGVLGDLASALLPQSHVVYQHLAESKAFTRISDLKPSATSVGWGSFLVDHSWYGQGFEIGGKTYVDGVYAHAPSKLSYHLGSRYSVFTGCAGPDSRATCGDGMQFHIVADGKTVWSVDRKPGDEAACFSVNVQSVNVLELYADHKSSTECDHAEWVNGKLYEDPAIDCRRLNALVPAASSVGWSPSFVEEQWTKDGFRVGGVRYTNGVFATTASKLLYPLRNKMDSFTACAGIDDVNGDCGAGAVFRVAVDGNELWSKQLANGDAAACFSVSTKGGRELELSVAMPDGSAGSCLKADWIDAEMCTIAKHKQVDCTVTPFTAYTACSHSCGTGFRSRTRTVETSPQHGGNPCPSLYEHVACNTNACPIDCIASPWGSWTPCTATCGGGSRKRIRSVSRAAVFGGVGCPTLHQDTSCAAQACPVDCVVGAFGAWGMCSQPCGGGMRNQTRVATTEAADGGRPCPTLEASEECNRQECPVDCAVTAWASWAPCSTSCGSGITRRSRTSTRAAVMGGKECPTLSDTKTCNTHACPIDCVLSPFGAWDTCSAQCGGGTHVHRRSIHQAAAYGGTACETLTEQRACNTHCCAGNEGDGNGGCQPCAMGRFQPSNDRNVYKGACQACPSARFQDLPGKAFCKLCAAGSHVSGSGATSCDKCAAGSFAAGGSATCKSCDAGKYSLEGWSFCAKCPHGQITSDSGQAACVTCATGKFARGEGTLCAECDAGSYFPLHFSEQLYKTDPLNSGTCTPYVECDAGMELVDRGPSDSGTCMACAAGTYKAIAGSFDTMCNACLGCPSGEYRTGCGDRTAGTCVACPTGHYKQSGAELDKYDASCKPFPVCEGGEFLADASATSQGQCTSCPNGKFKFGKGNWNTECTACQKCNKGQFLEKCAGANGGFCLGCPNGKFQPATGQVHCETCATGKYATESDAQRLQYLGSTECTPCDEGRFAATPGSAQCESCPVGKYNDQTGKADCYGRCDTGCSSGSWRKGCSALDPGTCTVCPEGKYTIPFHFGCVDDSACMVGDYHTEQGCKRCPAGKFKDVIGKTPCSSCGSCPQGTARVSCSEDQPGTCEECAPGSFKDSVGLGGCVKCDAGRFNDKSGSVACEECAAGQHQDDTGGTQCDSCAPGHFAVRGRENCEACAAGTYSMVWGSATCTQCAAGRYGTEEGAQHSAQCELCSGGSFQPAAGKTTCIECAAGLYSAVWGALHSSACFHCPAGKFSEKAGSAACAKCTKGTFSHTDQISMHHCQLCPKGRYQGADGEDTCEECASGHYASADGHHKCKECAKIDDTHFYWTENKAGAHQCTMHPVNCKVSDWTEVGQCSKSCGTGSQKQTRHVLVAEWGNGVQCSTFPLERSLPCNSQPCAIDCVPDSWLPWSKCTAPCGGGTQSRSRPVAHEAQYGGKSCSLSENLKCNEHKCMPRDCSHVECLMEEVNVVTAKNETLTGFKVKVMHDKAEQNGWFHTCGHVPNTVDKCRCTCKHTIHEWDPLHLSTESKKMAVKQLLANAAA
jgi:hypothetical protein